MGFIWDRMKTRSLVARMKVSFIRRLVNFPLLVRVWIEGRVGGPGIPDVISYTIGNSWRLSASPCCSLDTLCAVLDDVTSSQSLLTQTIIACLSEFARPLNFNNQQIRHIVIANQQYRVTKISFSTLKINIQIEKRWCSKKFQKLYQ